MRFIINCIVHVVWQATGDISLIQKAPEEGGRTLVNSIAESENGSVKEPVTDNVLVKEEEKEVGVVAFSVYRSYWVAVGMILTPIILLSLFFMQGMWYMYMYMYMYMHYLFVKKMYYYMCICIES